MLSIFPRFSRKAALLHAKLGEQGFTDGNQSLDVLGGRTLNALRNWRQRRSDADYRDSQGVSDKLKSHFAINDPRDLLSDAVSVQEFAAFIGYSRQQARRIIDQTYAEFFPTYSIFYSPERAARDLLDRFSGMHFIYRIDRNNALTRYTGQDISILRIPLAVRYMMKTARPPNADLYRVRCKLTIPSYTAPSACFEYDGYVTAQKHNTHYWFFENRSEENKDLLLMITDSLSVLRLRDAADNALKEHWFSEGVMLTRRQDDWPVHKVWKVVVVRVPSSSANEGDPEAAMSDQCSIISEDEAPPGSGSGSAGDGAASTCPPFPYNPRLAPPALCTRHPASPQLLQHRTAQHALAFARMLPGLMAAYPLFTCWDAACTG